MVYVFQISNIFATVLHFSTQRTLLLASHSGDDIGVLEQNSRRDCLGNYVQCAQSVWAVHLAINYHLTTPLPRLSALTYTSTSRKLELWFLKSLITDKA